MRPRHLLAILLTMNCLLVFYAIFSGKLSLPRPRNFHFRPLKIATKPPTPAPTPIRSVNLAPGERFDHTKYDALSSLLSGYKAFHDSVMSERPANSNMRYIVFSPDASGFGNRVRVLLAGFLLSVFTGRVFLVDWQTPVRLDELFEFTLDLNWDSQSMSLVGGSRVVTLSCGKPVNSELYITRDTRVLEVLDEFPETTLMLQGCGDINQILVENNVTAPLVQRYWGQNARPRQVYRDLLAFLFKPSPELSQMILPYRESMRKANHTISMHIRTGKHAAYTVMLLNGEETKFFDCAERFSQTWEGTTNYMLMTDSKIVLEGARARFGDKLVYVEEPIVHSGHQQLYDENGKERTRSGLFKVVADWWLFGEADLMIPMGGSSFSRSAVWRSSSPLADILATYPLCGVPGEVGFKEVVWPH